MGGEPNDGDIWDLKLEDLFSDAPAESEPAKNEFGPYVINLATSVEPISLPSSTLLNYERTQIYQVTAWKNDRLLFRLRLGPINSELEANAILADILRDYPDAAVLPACEDDIRMIAAVAASATSRGSSANDSKSARSGPGSSALAARAEPVRREPPAPPRAAAKETTAAIHQAMNARTEAPTPIPPRASLSASAAPRKAPHPGTPSAQSTSHATRAPHSPPSWLQEAARAVLESAAPLPPFVAAGARRLLARDAAPAAVAARSVAAPPPVAAPAPPAAPVVPVAVPAVVAKAPAGASARSVAPNNPPLPATRESASAVETSAPVAERPQVKEAAPAPRAEAAKAREPVKRAAPPAATPFEPPKTPTPPVVADDLAPIAWDEAPLTEADDLFLSLSLEPEVVRAEVPAPTRVPAPAAATSAPEWSFVVHAPRTTVDPASPRVEATPARKHEVAPATPEPLVSLSLAPDSPRPPIETTPAAPVAVPPAATTTRPARSTIETPSTAPDPRPAAPESAPTGSADDLEDTVESLALSLMIDLTQASTTPAPAASAAVAAAPAPHAVAAREAQAAIPVLAAAVAPAKGRQATAAAPAKGRPSSSKSNVPVLDTPVARGSRRSRKSGAASSAPKSPAAAPSTPRVSAATAPKASEPPPSRSTVVLTIPSPRPANPERPRPPPNAMPLPAARAAIAKPAAPAVATPVAQPPAAAPIAPAAAAPAAAPDPKPVVAPVAKPTSPSVAAPVAAPALPPVARPSSRPTLAPVSAPVWRPLSTPIAASVAAAVRPAIARPAMTPFVAPRPMPAVMQPAARAPSPPPAMQPSIRPPVPGPRPTPVPAAHAPAAHAPAPASSHARRFEVLPGSLPSVDSTQTMRALTMTELEDDGSEKLYVIQLALSVTEIQPEQVPNLAIFNEYRLYSAVGREDGKVMHALRLGFFNDEGPAVAVAGYLSGYFEGPKVTRVSAAERERFATRRVSARKDSGESGVHAAIDLSSPQRAPTTSLADLKVAAAVESLNGRRPPAARR
jgi:hypothetical protein